MVLIIKNEMNIGIVSVDSKMPNLALMKISAYHKNQGDTVEFYNPLFSKNIDLIYASKVFSNSPDYSYYPENIPIIKGGHGYNNDVLPGGVENIYPDYSLYEIDYALGYTSRGCIRNCPFCIVPEKEGKLRSVNDIYNFWNGQKEIVLLDNCLNGNNEHFKLICSQIKKEKIKVDFQQGLDLRILTEEQARILSGLKYKKQLRFAWDNIKDEKNIIFGLNLLYLEEFPMSQIMIYVLIGFNSSREEDLYRVELLKDIGVDVFAMPYNKKDPYQKQFCEWVNRKAMFKSMPFMAFLSFIRHRRKK